MRTELSVYKTKVVIYLWFGNITIILNPRGQYWNIWLISDDLGCIYRGTCFHKDMWYCIYALIKTEGRYNNDSGHSDINAE